MGDKKEEIERIFRSLDDLKPASANPFLYQKIKNRMQSRHAITQPDVRWAFALTVILILNVFTWMQLKTNDSAKTPANSIASEMGFTTNVYQY